MPSSLSMKPWHGAAYKNGPHEVLFLIVAKAKNPLLPGVRVVYGVTCDQTNNRGFPTQAEVARKNKITNQSDKSKTKRICHACVEDFPAIP